MYLPRLRKLSTVMTEIKAEDPDTVLTRYFIEQLVDMGKIYAFKYADAWMINIDELYGYLQGEVFNNKQVKKIPKRSVKMTGEIYREFLKEDEDTPIRKLNLRLFVKDSGLWCYILPSGKWILDFDEVVYKLNPKEIGQRYDLPRMRFHDDSVRNFKRRHPNLKVTINTAEEAFNSDNVFKTKNGGRWIINYDQMERQVYKNLQEKGFGMF